MILIYGRRHDALLREQKHHHGHQFFLVLASWLLGSAKFACLQRQKPAMFAQMPVCVYRHFTGAVCTTSSDGRFALFSAAFSLATGLSNSSDILLPDIFRTAPIAVGSLLRAAERLVALPTAWDLFICAKDLFVEAKAPQASAPKRLR